MRSLRLMAGLFAFVAVTAGAGLRAPPERTTLVDMARGDRAACNSAHLFVGTFERIHRTYVLGQGPRAAVYSDVSVQIEADIHDTFPDTHTTVVLEGGEYDGARYISTTGPRPEPGRRYLMGFTPMRERPVNWPPRTKLMVVGYPVASSDLLPDEAALRAERDAWCWPR